MSIEDCEKQPIGPSREPTSEDWVEARIATWPHDDWDGLMEFISHEWDHDYGHMGVFEGEWTFVTGGWSRNEDLLCALRQNHVIHALYWQSSHRGGKEVYYKKP